MPASQNPKSPPLQLISHQPPNVPSLNIPVVMDWPATGQIVPVVLNSTRPARHRGRLNSEHPQNRQVFYQDQFSLVVPADGGGGGRHGRSSSMSAPYGGPPAVVVNNEMHQEQSPSPRHRRRSSHGHDHHYSDDDDWEEHRRDRRRRNHSRSHGSRTPSPLYDSETEERLRKLKLLEKKEEEAAAQERFEEEQIIKAARKEKKLKEEIELKKRAVEEYELKKIEEAAKAKKKKEEEEEAFRERAYQTFGAAGYSKQSVEDILNKAEKGKKSKHSNQIMDLSRPTYIKVNKKYLSPDTLDEYDLPWKWDEVSFHPYPLFP